MKFCIVLMTAGAMTSLIFNYIQLGNAAVNNWKKENVPTLMTVTSFAANPSNCSTGVCYDPAWTMIYPGPQVFVNLYYTTTCGTSTFCVERLSYNYPVGKQFEGSYDSSNFQHVSIPRAVFDTTLYFGLLVVTVLVVLLYLFYGVALLLKYIHYETLMEKTRESRV